MVAIARNSKYYHDVGLQIDDDGTPFCEIKNWANAGGPHVRRGAATRARWGCGRTEVILSCDFFVLEAL